MMTRFQQNMQQRVLYSKTRWLLPSGLSIWSSRFATLLTPARFTSSSAWTSCRARCSNHLGTVLMATSLLETMSVHLHGLVVSFSLIQANYQFGSSAYFSTRSEADPLPTIFSTPWARLYCFDSFIESMGKQTSRVGTVERVSRMCAHNGNF